MKNIGKLAVYCGSKDGADPTYAEAARELADVMTAHGIDLVYGGGKLGLMGIVADRVLENGGKVYGVIPQALIDVEVAHEGCTELYGVADMHERKAKMTDLADAFVCLPGGIGTLDELFEAWTWNALGYHSKPFCLLNVGAFWDGLDGFMDTVTRQGFLSEDRRRQLLLAHSPQEAIEKLDEAVANPSDGMIW
ncbi:hypothetical protein FHS50_000429 [Sphingomicrobium lutaoense]|uniref:Cytokinin riboside 5'-monophosphate phosphoribohydrolase n=1 Tax=Sphingomicrobium lutaoense TaxID=515949 RepID=A0A839YWJ6_9SPHN|nr:hypothetical protein [Sphingomicrobium lutaoense]